MSWAGLRASKAVIVVWKGENEKKGDGVGRLGRWRGARGVVGGVQSEVLLIIIQQRVTRGPKFNSNRPVN